MFKTLLKNKIKLAAGVVLLFSLAQLLRINLLIPLYLLSLYLYARRFRKNLLIKEFNLLYLALLFLVIFVCSYMVIKKGLPIYYIPFSVIPMLSAMLISELALSFLIITASALSVAAIGGNNFYLGLLFLVSGVFSSILVFDARRRMAIIRAGAVIGAIQSLGLFFIARSMTVVPGDYLMMFLNGIISSIIVIGILPVFEYLFKIVTNISLLELADFNHPLLQRLILEAPGTYHHSLIVGNLSEAACHAIGANALLARVGAYYHDIGKLYKPQYFIENQEVKANKHDDLSPTISKMVIMNHVKEGVELAKKHRLNPRLIDFIQQHHGNSIVFYFYLRALENLEEEQNIKEEGFRYPGPKPDTKETAVVLLADSVEAAARALKEPAPANIQEMVHKIINNKFIDGQLDNCDLALKDLEKISAVFVHILSGIYHNRVPYPNERSENNHKKSSAKNSH